MTNIGIINNQNQPQQDAQGQKNLNARLKTGAWSSDNVGDARRPAFRDENRKLPEEPKQQRFTECSTSGMHKPRKYLLEHTRNTEYDYLQIVAAPSAVW